MAGRGIEERETRGIELKRKGWIDSDGEMEEREKYRNEELRERRMEVWNRRKREREKLGRSREREINGVIETEK